MLQLYTLMKIMNKMKNFEAKYEEWWEVAKEYFIKELENSLAHHRVDEIIMKYKLEAYEKIFLDFIYGIPTSTEVSSQDEEIEARPNGIAQEEEVQIEESQDFRNGAAWEEEVQLKIPHDLKRKG